MVVGEDGVVGRVGLELGDLAEGGEVCGLGAQERLLERLDRPVHQRQRDPLAVGLAHDRAVVGAVHGEPPLAAAAGPDGDARYPDRSQLLAVTVEQPVAPPDDVLRELVDIVDATGGVHPAGVAVPALVDEELPPGRGAIDVEAGIARHLLLGAEEEAGVGVDEQQRVAADGVGGCDGDAVRSLGLAIGGAAPLVTGIIGEGDGPLAIERLQPRERRALDVAADAALAERQRHPRLEAGQHLWLHRRMIGEVAVQPIRPRVHQRPQPGRAARVIRLQHDGIDEQPLAQVLPHRRLALRLGTAAKCGQVVDLDPVEVVLSLGIDHPEHRVGIAAAMDMRDAPVVAGHRDARRLRRPAGAVGRRRRCRQGEQHRQPCRHPYPHHSSPTAATMSSLVHAQVRDKPVMAIR